VLPHRLSYWRETFALERCYADTQTGEAPDRKPGAAMCVQEIRVQCVLQFTLVHAAGCALHRHTSRVIHRPEVWIFVLFSLLDEQHGEPCCCRRFVCLFFLRWCLVCISPARSNRSRGNRPSSISVHTQKPPAAKGLCSLTRALLQE